MVRRVRNRSEVVRLLVVEMIEETGKEETRNEMLESISECYHVRVKVHTRMI